MKFCLKLIVWCSYMVCLNCLPVENNYRRQVPSDEALKFMKRYGYLVDGGGQSEAIYSEENLSNIIKNMQRFGAIKETGIIDNATLNLMSSPRCGVVDIIPNKDRRRRKRYATVKGWDKRHITYYISNWSSHLGEDVVARNIQKALDVWGGYGRLTFSRSYSPEADIIVSFSRGYHGDRYPFDGPGQILAHAFFPGHDESPSLSGDIHFDDDENWVEKPVFRDEYEEPEGTNFFTVALHELGHSLGLSHSDVQSSVMFPYYKGWDQNSNSLLDYDDILGMYTLYIQRRLKHDELTRPQPEETTTSTTTTSTTTLRTPSRHPDSGERKHNREDTTRSWRRHNPWFGPRRPTTTERSHNNDDKKVLYEGDDEFVEVHKEHDPHRTIPKNNSPSLPYICHGHFDAVATLRGELFIFKDEYLWRLRDKGVISSGYPTSIRQMFPNLPKEIKKVDAAYQRPDGHIVLFTGSKVWIFDGFDFVENSPLTLSYFGLPEYLDDIDAVQTWTKNGKTYFYKSDRFWRYNETAKSMDPGYPMSMDRWNGVPINLDAATTWKDGITYFFKGALFWKFDNNWVKPTESSPLPVAPIWLGCKEEADTMRQLYGS
ncbi:matrix metalloproteinase-24-like [Euwallacea similis]|uniref:matrix metalloproteinase-24-like n=1 Tax=Euwallacea similis TaxID=1736056 RepID=UPI00344FD181